MKIEALLYEKLDNNKVHCFLCAHNCHISPEHYGICGMRQNIAGVLYTYAYKEVIAEAIDPIEKKPLFHFLPGSTSYSIATPGCNFKCSFCQNWQISQTSIKDGYSTGYQFSPADVVKNAIANKCRSISYTYTEPTIFFEYALETAKLAKAKGLYNIFVTNGFMSAEALEMISPYLSAANVDLKSFKDSFYQKVCKGRLQPVLDTIRLMRKLNIWLEVTTLVIPQENDSDSELKAIAEFIASVDQDIPWHVSKFHPEYKFTEHEGTDIKTLEKAKKIGYEVGLKYVYLGNVMGGADTFCYQCKKPLIKRAYMQPQEINLTTNSCPNCNSKIAGVWR